MRVLGTLYWVGLILIYVGLMILNFWVSMVGAFIAIIVIIIGMYNIWNVKQFSFKKVLTSYLTEALLILASLSLLYHRMSK